jgi:type IV pilus assembly protein PilE
MRNSRGFTLIEIMIVVVVISILAAIAFPSYRDSVRKSRRAEAKASLLEAAQILERCFTEFNTYTGPPPPNGCSILTDTDADGTGDTINLTSDTAPLNGEGYYTITTNPGAETLTGNTYRLTATPTSVGGQNQDTRCATFTLDQAGVKGATNTDCW